MAEATLNRTWLVYKITLLDSGLIYVGITNGSLEKRWSSHKCTAKRGGRLTNFHRAIAAHGADRFDVQKIASAATVDEAFALEQYWIAQLNTVFPHGFNSTRGGSGVKRKGWHHSPESIQRMRLAQAGKVNSEAAKAKMAEAKRGKPLSAEHRQKLGDVRRGKTIPQTSLAMLSSPKTKARSGAKGVTMTSAGRWMVRSKINGRTIYIGTYSSLAEAKEAYADMTMIRINRLLCSQIKVPSANSTALTVS